MNNIKLVSSDGWKVRSHGRKTRFHSNLFADNPEIYFFLQTNKPICAYFRYKRNDEITLELVSRSECRVEKPIETPIETDSSKAYVMCIKVFMQNASKTDEPNFFLDYCRLTEDEFNNLDHDMPYVKYFTLSDLSTEQTKNTVEYTTSDDYVSVSITHID